VLPVPADYRAPYDPNIDIVMAAIYGAIPVTDTKLLATAAQLRSQWADPGSTYFYPINGADQQRGIGPLLGRYPGDVYDGDTDAQAGDHPWAVSTANFAELYYRLAGKIIFGGTAILDAVTNGLTMPWSSGPVEGRVNHIKMIKRQMFGRAGLPLLRKRVLLTARI
jgi:glucoamylase